MKYLEKEKIEFPFPFIIAYLTVVLLGVYMIPFSGMTIFMLPHAIFMFFSNLKYRTNKKNDMDIKADWNRIRQHFNKSFKSNFYVSIASVDNENNPTVTPIGSLFLNDDQAGFYFEKFPKKLPQHAKSNNNICVLGVNSNRLFWMKSLFKGKFNDFPAIKLYGILEERRQASEKEINRLNRRMRTTKGLKGNNYLWTEMHFVREITFTKSEKINLGKMTNQL